MPRDKSWRIAHPVSNLRTSSRETNQGKGWMRTTEGTVRTPDGIVEVYGHLYERPDGSVVEHTTLDLARDGRCFSRRWDGQTYSNRYLITLAVRFARDVAQQAGGAR